MRLRVSCTERLRLLDVFLYSPCAGSIVRASSGSELFQQHLFPRRIAVSLAFFLLLVGLGGGASAEQSAPSLSIDYDRAPAVAVDAKNVPVVEILDQLAAALHIEVDYGAGVDKSLTISGSFKGEVNDILQRLLPPSAGYVIWYRGSAIDRIFITAWDTAATVADRASSSDVVDAAEARDALPATTLSAGVTAASGGASKAQQPGNPLSNLLQAQAMMMEHAVAKAGLADGSQAPVSGTGSPPGLQSGFSPAGAAPASLAAMTRTAQANVRMLAKALNAVCIGASCAR